MQEKKYNDAKKEIRSILLTYQKGASLDEFLKTYRSLIGQRLPARSLGFSTDVDYLRSMPDVVHISTNDVGKICLTGIADKASKHIQQLVSKQRKSKPNNGSRRNVRQPSRPMISYKPPPFVAGPVRAEIIQVAAMYPDGISFPSFVLAYRKKFNKYLPLEKGLQTLESMVNVISELEIRTVRTEKKIFCKNIIQNGSASGEASRTVKKQVSSQHVEGGKNQVIDKSSNGPSVHNSGISEAVQKNFIKVLEKYPEGILAVHFHLLYENVTGQPFEMLELGYNSILDLFDALPKIFKRVLGDNKNWIILPANASIKFSPEGEDTTHHKKVSPLKVREGIPADAACPVLQYEPPTMRKNVNLEEYLPVFVSAIINPSLFWFQLQLDEEIDQFERLEKDIGYFYDNYSSYRYKMHDADIFMGATCIVQCPDDKQWYRAVIKAIPTSDLVNVLFVDYGSRENVPRNMLRYARSKYMDFPAHAFRAQLAGLKPAQDGAKWNSRSGQRFIELCECATLMASLKPIDHDSFSVYLCDTSKDIDVHVNDTLVREGYADSCFETQNYIDDFSNEFSNSGQCSDVNSEAEICDTRSSSNNTLQAFGSTDSTTDYKDDSALDSEKEISTSSNLPVNRKLTFSVEKECNDLQPGTSRVTNERCSRRHIKRVKLDCDYKFHIVNYEHKPYLSAGDVSRLLWNDGDSSCLAQRLMYIDKIVPTITISKEDYPELFKQCIWYKLADMESNDSSISLYTLENALKILNVFGQPSVCVRHTIQHEMMKFDSSHPFWHKFSYDDWEEIETEIQKENLGTLCLYDLKAKLESLRMKRMKLIAVNSTSCVAEIKRTEHLQFIIQKRIDYIKSICSGD